MILPDNCIVTDAVKIGVYFLLDEDEIVYIGQSTNIYRRLSSHLSLKKFKFTKFAYLEFPINLLSNEEVKYIKKFKPKYNTNFLHKRAEILLSVKRKKHLAMWEKRRQQAKALRMQDPGKWTYKRIGKKFGVTAERARQWVNGRKKHDDDRGTLRVVQLPGAKTPGA